MLDISRNTVQAKQLKDALAQVSDDARLEAVADSKSILHAVTALCSKCGVDTSKMNDADLACCINSIAYSIYAGGVKVMQC